MTPTVDILEAIAKWLADQDLAQYSTTGNYENVPAKPAVVFAAVDVPDTLLLLEVKDDLRFVVDRPGGLLVRFTYRTPGHDARPVERLADAVLQRFSSLAASGPLDRLGINAPPVLLSVGSVALRANAVRLSERGLPELAPRSKYAGNRYVRADVYRISVF